MLFSMGEAGHEQPGGLKRRGGERDPRRAYVITTVVAVALIAALLLASCSSETRDRAVSLGYPNGNSANTRGSRGSIDSSTVSDLSPAWTRPAVLSGEQGTFISSPVVADGVVYLQDLNSNVRAIDIESGDTEWERKFEAPTTGPNGVFVDTNRIYGATPQEAFALDRGTGEEIWSTRLTANPAEGIRMAPGYHDGLVYLSTVPSAFEGGERGVLWALNAKTGKKVWSFDTVPKDLWGDARRNFGGGLTNPPAFDAKGFMYFGVGGPGPLPGTKRDPWGSSRQGPNLYTDSLVKLDAKTGKLKWDFQLTPHAVCVWDLQDSPLLLNAGGHKLVVAAGKAGIVVALNRQTGAVAWKRPVGIHNGHDRDGLQAMRGNYSTLGLPMKVFPGSEGGVEAPMSTDGSSIFVPVVNHSTTLFSQSEAEQSELTTGELVALDATTGRVRWSHRFNSAPTGATSSVNDLAFATTSDGTLYAFNATSGKVEWTTALPEGIDAGLAFDETTLVAPAGLGVTPKIVAYRLG
jgi:outer membrane protein assembly factor BamB